MLPINYRTTKTSIGAKEASVKTTEVHIFMSMNPGKRAGQGQRLTL